jgi:hypothetical protein
MVLTYLMCALISQVPSWYLNRSQVGQKICLANDNSIKVLRNDIVQYTLQFALVSSIVVLLNFKMFIQPKSELVPDLWLQIKTMNSWVATALIA